MIRANFCLFVIVSLYNGARGQLLLQGTLFGMIYPFIILFGLLLFIIEKKISKNIVKYITIMFVPLFITALFNECIYDTYFVIQVYLTMLYIINYIKVIGFSFSEYMSVASSALVSLWYLMFPKYYESGVEMRWSGISADPNYTAISLMSGLSAIICLNIKATNKQYKTYSVLLGILCIVGIIATGSRAGFIGLMVLLCIYCLINRHWGKYLRSAIFIIILIGFNIGDIKGYLPNTLKRFYAPTGELDISLSNTAGRDFWWSLAWKEINNKNWFYGDGVKGVYEFGEGYGRVPHNSVMDIGIMYGRMCFYIYALFLGGILLLNATYIFMNRKTHNIQKTTCYLMAIMFVPSFVILNSLSFMMSIPFILCVSFGCYPLLNEKWWHYGK